MSDDDKIISMEDFKAGKHDESDILTQDELDNLVQRLLEGAAENGIIEEDLIEAVQKVREWKFGGELFSTIMNHHEIELHWDDSRKDIVMRKP